MEDFYNARGQRLGSFAAGRPKARTPLYAREVRRGNAAELGAADWGYQLDEYFPEFFLARPPNFGTCGIIGQSYGTTEIIGDSTFHKGGVTCWDSPPRVSFDSLKSETNEEKCGGGQMLRLNKGTLTIFPDTLHVKPFWVNARYRFEDGYRYSRIQVDSIHKHELGHVEDIKCTAKKLPTRKVMLDGCFCKNELDSLWKLEQAKDSIIYSNMFIKADSAYHAIYGNSGYPDPQVPYVCP